MAKSKKKILGLIKLQIPAGKANPSPPVGPALGQKGLNIMDFCKQFNAATQKMEPGIPVPVVITAYEDKSFVLKQSCLRYLTLSKRLQILSPVLKNRAKLLPVRLLWLRLKKLPSQNCRI